MKASIDIHNIAPFYLNNATLTLTFGLDQYSQYENTVEHTGKLTHWGRVKHTRLGSAMSLSRQMLSHSQLELGGINFGEIIINQNRNLSIIESASEVIVYEMVAMLSRGRWVKSSSPYVSVLTLSIVVWRVRQWPTTTTAASFLMEYVTLLVCKPHPSIATWNLFHWRCCTHTSKVPKKSHHTA